MARKTVWVSDLTGKDIPDGGRVTITVKYEDGRRGQIVADAHPEDPIVKTLEDKGVKQARRGRKPKETAEPKRLHAVA